MNYDKHPKPKKERKLPPEVKAAFITVGILLGIACLATVLYFGCTWLGPGFLLIIPTLVGAFFLWLYVLDQIDPM